MYTMKDFIEKKIAVSFANREERIKFLKMCQKAGLRWRGGQSPTDSFALRILCAGHQIECGFGDISVQRDGLTYKYPEVEVQHE